MTDHQPAAEPATVTTQLAAELRGILAELDNPDTNLFDTRERLLRLAEHAEQLATEPVEVDATTELTASFGLNPEQQIRSDALDSAARLLAPSLADWLPATSIDVQVDAVAALWLELAGRGAELIRDGSQPEGEPR